MHKILITGGAGFIGSNFVRYCLTENNKVLNYDLLTYAGNLDNLKDIEPNHNYKFVKGDICDNNLFIPIAYFVVLRIWSTNPPGNALCKDIIDEAGAVIKSSPKKSNSSSVRIL